MPVSPRKRVRRMAVRMPMRTPMRMLALSLVAGAMLAGCSSRQAPLQAAAATPAAPVQEASVQETPVAARTPADACPADPGWNDPSPPRHVHGDTWYVGTCGIASVLIRGEAGHILIDSGTERGAALVLENLRALGVDPREVRRLLVSHEHMDHAGGLAALQAATGAPVLALPRAIPALRSGRNERSDPQFLDLTPFAPVADVRAIADGQTVRVGRLAVTAHATPGHTAGGTSWTWRSCEDAGGCVDIAYVDSLTAIADRSYRFSDESAHPGVVATFRATLARVEALPCDVLITPHPGASALWERLGPAATRPLRQDDGCRAYAAAARARLERVLAQERADTDSNGKDGAP